MSQTQPNSLFCGRRAGFIGFPGTPAVKIISTQDFINPTYAFEGMVTIKNGDHFLFIDSRDDVGETWGYKLSPGEELSFKITSPIIVYAVKVPGQDNVLAYCDTYVILNPSALKLNTKLTSSTNTIEKVF